LQAGLDVVSIGGAIESGNFYVMVKVIATYYSQGWRTVIWSGLFERERLKGSAGVRDRYWKRVEQQKGYSHVITDSRRGHCVFIVRGVFLIFLYLRYIKIK